VSHCTCELPILIVYLPVAKVITVAPSSKIITAAPSTKSVAEAVTKAVAETTVTEAVIEAATILDDDDLLTPTAVNDDLLSPTSTKLFYDDGLVVMAVVMVMVVMLVMLVMVVFARAHGTHFADDNVREEYMRNDKEALELT